MIVSDTGRINSQLILHWLMKFEEAMQPIKPVLIMDSHASHMSPGQCYPVSIGYLLFDLSHTSHLLQPLDVSEYNSWKVGAVT